MSEWETCPTLSLPPVGGGGGGVVVVLVVILRSHFLAAAASCSSSRSLLGRSRYLGLVATHHENYKLLRFFDVLI